MYIQTNLNSKRIPSIPSTPEFQTFQQTQQDGPIGSKRVYGVHMAINALVFSGLISNDHKLRETIISSLRLSLPPVLLEPMLVLLEGTALRFPSPSTLSRWRFVLDAAYMLIMRDMNQADFYRYWMIDSSTQGGTDYELQYVCFVEKSSMQTLASAARRLIMLRQDEEVSTEDDQIYEEEIALVDILKSLLVTHIPPPIVLASGRVTVVDKFQVAMHGTYLETGSSQALANARERTVASTTDLGVELSLPQVQPSPFSNVLPHQDHGECPPAHDVDDDFEKLASAVIGDDISLWAF